ncbi:MAG: hypothetical protein KAS21_00590 [Candidatus Aminicenantes bacterium]|nr:hypothetical protein [Candidatus Aminicenantes bacterium]MCK5003552.1 hypothetical protein [Candidatus Aminicenantes bacterium]
MKKSLSLSLSAILFFMILFSLSGLEIFAANNLSTGVYLYTKPNYKGFEHRVTIDHSQLPTSKYVTAPRRAYVNFNDAVSSIRLVGISYVAVYTNADFRGNCETITRDIPNLNKTSIGNNTMSSIKINARCAPSGPTVTLYDQKNFQGRSVVINGNVPDLAVSNFRNKTSSIKLTNVRSIAVFNRTQYQGKCQTIKNDTFTLARTGIGQNSIASIKINSECQKLMELTIRNRSGLLIQVHIPLEGTRGKKEIASGQKKTFYFDYGKLIQFYINALEPLGDMAPLPAWKRVCDYNFRMEANNLITVKGSYFRQMNCTRTVLPGGSQ